MVEYPPGKLALCRSTAARLFRPVAYFSSIPPNYKYTGESEKSSIVVAIGNKYLVTHGANEQGFHTIHFQCNNPQDVEFTRNNL